MKNTGIRIIKAANVFPSNSFDSYDSAHTYMRGYKLDLTRKTAVLLRQSRKGADESNPESRLHQESLAQVAVEIRDDHDATMVEEYDEGSGVSGQKKIYERPKMLQLMIDIKNGTLGSVIVAREDRLFRDKHLTDASTFADECDRHGVLLIVAGRRCYDFRNHADSNSFVEKMKEAYGYIEGHVKYMQEMKMHKLKRGEWVGGGLAAPYVLDRHAIQAARSHRRTIKEFGSDEIEEAFITQAFRPIIYLPWQPIAIDLFQKLKLFDFSRARLGRYIEEKKYVFPFPIAEDAQKYIFKANMKLIPGLGYTFSDTACLPHWITNLAHIGFVSAGKDDEGRRIYIEGAFDAAIERELFEECYEALMGCTLTGEPSTMTINRRRFTRRFPAGQNKALLTRCLQSPDGSASFYARTATPGKEYYVARARRQVAEGDIALSAWDNNALWSLPVHVFDRAVVGRLAELAEHDKQLASRVEHYFTELAENRISEKELIQQQIAQFQKAIERYDRLLLDPAAPLTEAQERRYIEGQAGVERELEKVQASLKKYESAEPNQFIPAFYRILGEAPGEFWNLDTDRKRKMLILLVDLIEIENISPHLYSLRLKWKDPVAQPWDCALIFRRNSLRSYLKGDDWTPEEDELLRHVYATGDKFEMHKLFPRKSGEAMKQHAQEVGVQRAANRPKEYSPIHRSLCYVDWVRCCEVLGVNPETEEGQTILKRLNYFARTTEPNSAAFWWLLPVVEMADFDATMSLRAPDSSSLYAQAELHHQHF